MSRAVTLRETDAQWHPIAKVQGGLAGLGPKAKTELRGTAGRLLWVSAADDIFLNNISPVVAEKVMRLMAEAYTTKFVLPTRNPYRALGVLLDGAWPDNVWFGALVTSVHDLYRLTDLARVPAQTRFAELEPIGPTEPDDLFGHLTPWLGRFESVALDGPRQGECAVQGCTEAMAGFRILAGFGCAGQNMARTPVCRSHRPVEFVTLGASPWADEGAVSVGIRAAMRRAQAVGVRTLLRPDIPWGVRVRLGL